MKFYLWFSLVMMVLTFFARVSWLEKDEFPRRTRGSESLELIFGLGMICWVVALLWSM